MDTDAVRHILIKEHRKNCFFYESDGKQFMSNYLFYHDVKFYILTICNCWKHYESDCEFLESWLRQSLDASKIPYNKISRSHDFIRDFRRSQYHGLINREAIHELNYTYSNNAGKCFGIVTEMKLYDVLLKQDKLYDTYKSAEKYIKEFFSYPFKEEFNEYYLNKLYELYYYNSFNQYSHIFDSVDVFVKNFRSHIKKISHANTN